VTREPFNESGTRNWRDIPQPIKPRAMSRGGRWRLALEILRGTLVAAVIGLVGWGGWKTLGALHEDSQAMPAAAKAVPLRRPELVTSTGGVLTSEWLERTLALPRNISLMEVNLEKVCARVLAESQVLTAKARRRAPDGLIVEVTERMPVAQVRAEWQGRQQSLLIARDGVVFAGDGYDAGMVAGLPWLAGINLVRRDNTFRPIDGMEIVDELLGKAQTEAAHLHVSWRIVSLERLFTDREIEVTTVEGFKIIFGVSDARESGLARRKNFVDQLSRLDMVWEKVGHMAIAEGTIDLSLGTDVPVSIKPLAPAEPAAMPVRASIVAPVSLSLFSRPPSQPNREL
jgi:cell division septal protein FtsQ